jgi:NAD(P)-dependent dehydrogenase (short-subunit alcohol dehydrogenase family)
MHARHSYFFGKPDRSSAQQYRGSEPPAETALRRAAPDIRINAIDPGWFRTELAAVFHANPTRCAAMLEKIPAGRFGATLFFCSDAARYVTGQLLYIDGGYMASI